MSGWYRMQRGWMEHALFKGEPFTRAMAFQWMIEAACWRPQTFDIRGKSVDLQRGQLCASREQLAKQFQWSPSAVERFLTRLKTEQMIERETGQGRTIITIWNYSKYQDEEAEAGQDFGQPSGHKSDRSRTAKEEGKEFKKDTGGGSASSAGREYAFAGRVIRLNAADHSQWKARYHAIPDFDAELASLDAWYASQPEEKRRSWFHSAQGNLNRKHQEAVRADAGRSEKNQQLQTVFDASDAFERRRQRWEREQREQAR